jgi:heat-inducible transcriptional repressor
MDLDSRKQSLLQAIVVTYVERAEPVGSSFLAGQESLGVRSATIRNELAEMTERGYLRQPHTSAGRIPSDLGYRYFVDHLMTWDRLPAAEARTLRAAQKVSEGDLEVLLAQTVRVLSSLTRYTSVATPPTSDEPLIRQVHVVQLGGKRLLAVVVLDNGQIVHRFTDVPADLSPSEVTQLSNVLDGILANSPANTPHEVRWDDSLNPQIRQAAQALLTVIERGIAGEEGDLYLDGASRMLDQPEFRESDRVEPLVRFLEERKTAFETLQHMLKNQSLAVSIGHENPHESMQEVSVVAAKYEAGPRSSGWVAVLGPTRMHYSNAVAAVHFAARSLTETLNRVDR